MATILQRAFLSFVCFILLNGPFIFDNDHSCLAIRLSDKRHAVDWETLVNDEEAFFKRLMAARQRSSDRFRDFEEFDQLDRHTRKPKKQKYNDEEMETEIDDLSKLKESSTSTVSTTVEQEPVERVARLQSSLLTKSSDNNPQTSNGLFFAIIITCSVVGALGLVAAAIFWYKIQKQAEQAIESEYPSYGVSSSTSGGNRISPSSTMSDRKLAQSAQMFHYQQQRQQMIAQEKAHLDPNPADSDDSEDEAITGGDYTVYECPGLAPTGEMEVRNPLFAEPDASFNSPDQTTLHTVTTDNFYPQPSESSASNSLPKENSLS